jgi:membrane associated rhomboid family serine protease
MYGQQSRGRIAFPTVTPTIKKLIIINVLAFLLLSNFDKLFGLVPNLVIAKLHIWQFVTYMFMHGSFQHLFFNMLMLWMFGSQVEQLWGRKTFLQYYFFTGIGAGLVHLTVHFGSNTALIGASGSVFAILLAFATLFPNRTLLLFFVLPIKAKYLVLILGIIELLSVYNSDGIGHFAHLGGLLFGWIFMRGGKKYIDALTIAWKKRKLKNNPFRVVKDKPETGEQRVNEILDKISREGLDSLTEKERDILRKASN